ncbi:MAG: hypothetical protein H7Z21_09635, partial [Hymenobacter sp.]|nr:hypothetical protein [Hymenobacter sp.]
MATSAPNSTPDPRPTGDLEHLFRQKFAGAEVPPRAGLWEQLDHELLVEQNNTFRRRLGVHRWVAAACLLLLFSVSGWALLHQWQAPAPGLTAQGAAGSGRRAEAEGGVQSVSAEAPRSATLGAEDKTSTAPAEVAAKLPEFGSEEAAEDLERGFFPDESGLPAGLAAAR